MMHKIMLAIAVVVFAVLPGCGINSPDDFSDIESPDQISDNGLKPTEVTASKPDEGYVNNELRLYQSGERIRAMVLRTDDGAQAFVGWHDSDLNIDCQFEKAEDGNTRCLPSSRIYLNRAMNSFSDAECTKELMWTGRQKECTLNLDWVSVSEQRSPCDLSSYVLYRNATLFTGERIYTLSGENCVDVSESWGIYAFVDSIGEKVDPGIFVVATTSVLE